MGISGIDNGQLYNSFHRSEAIWLLFNNNIFIMNPWEMFLIYSFYEDVCIHKVSSLEEYKELIKKNKYNKQNCNLFVVII